MRNTFDVKTQTNNDSAQDKKEARREYSKPLLLDLGDLRTLTLGPSVGVGDSSGGGFPENSKFVPL